MEFELRFDIENIGNTIENHKENLKQHVSLMSDAVIVDGMYKQLVKIDNIHQLVNLGFYFDRDIKICGVGMNILQVQNKNE